MTLSRTHCAIWAAAALVAPAPVAAQQEAPEAAPEASAEAAVSGDLVVTLLGTGTPTLSETRFGAANLVQAGGLNLLFDAGRGASIRVAQAGQTPGTLDAVFLTHFHSDHVNGLSDIYLTGYFVGATLKGRTEPFQIYGPTGTKQLMDGLQAAHSWDIETRRIDEGTPEATAQVVAHEADEGVVFEQNGVTVTAIPVNHGQNMFPAVAARI
ncbi:MBL fold metallo-hydrolase [Paracoccus sp. M683]|uniref:MBL fold metallo-hydrolase n=1 Tax=Paracoccus sp. M683 TaxID=2594268 RepID=UPI00117C1FC1|nr:MBL fold metallo-hydrolase [Paracoccus sp. M683]TRW99213.1 MBL fold metallo-hydrolase [Paracoccus sp. M683]